LESFIRDSHMIHIWIWIWMIINIGYDMVYLTMGKCNVLL
jgi:hypothetical protein